MSIPFIDLKTQYKQVEEAVKKGIDGVLEHGAYIMGPEIGELEGKLADYTDSEFAVGCGSGTDALLMALMAQGVGPGDAVFTTPFTFIATAEVVALLGATPVFVDIDPVTYNMDPDDLRRKIDDLQDNRPELKARGVIVVDIFGQAADYDAIEPLTQNYGLFLIVDAAQSFGATYKGRSVCSIGDMACTSFFPAKPLGCYGDGGMIFCHSEDARALLTSIRVHGMGTHKYDNDRIGINGRLDSIQAAVLLAKFAIFPDEIAKRQEVADRYAALLGPIDGLTPPAVAEGCQSVWAQYCVLARDADHRTQCMEQLQEAGVPSTIYYPKPLHLQKAFDYLGYAMGDFPVTEDVAGRIFALPMHPYLTAEDQEIVVAPLKG